MQLFKMIATRRKLNLIQEEEVNNDSDSSENEFYLQNLEIHDEKWIGVPMRDWCYCGLKLTLLLLFTVLVYMSLRLTVPNSRHEPNINGNYSSFKDFDVIVQNNEMIF